MPKRKRRGRAVEREALERAVSRRKTGPSNAAFDWIIQALLVATVFLIPVVMDPRGRSWTLVKSALVVWLGAAMGLAWLLSALRQGRLSWQRSRLNPPVFAFVAAAAMSVIPSKYRAMGIFPLAEYAAYAAFFFCIVNWAAGRGRAERLLWAAAGGILLVGVYGAFQRHGYDFMTYPESEHVQDRILSSQGNATFLAGYLIILLPMLGLFALGVHRSVSNGRGIANSPDSSFARPFQIIARGLFLVAEACLIWTWTRAAFVGLLAAAVVTVFALRWNPLTTLRAIRQRFDYGQAAFIAAAVILAAVLAWRQPQYERDIVKDSAKALVIALTKGSAQPVRTLIDPAPASEGPGQGAVAVESESLAAEVEWSQRRLHMWQAAYHTFRQHLIWGSGLGTYQVYMRSHQWSAAKHERTPALAGSLHAHNEYLETLSDEGILGAAAFLWLLGAYLLTAVRVLRRADAFRRVVVAGLLAGVAAVLSQNLFAISFRQTGVVLYFWLALGLTAAAESTIKGGEPARAGFRLPVARGGVLAAGVIACLGLLGYLAYVLVIPVRAERYMFIAANAIDRQDKETGARMLEEQIKLTPKRPEPWAMLGPLYGMMGENAPDPESQKRLYEKSLRTLKRADELCPNYRNVRRNLAAAYSRLDKRREAIRVLKAAAKAQDAPWLYADMARNYIALNELPAAEASARKAVEQDPNDAEYRHLLGYALSVQGKKVEALEQFKAAAAIEPRAPRNYVQMGYAYAYLGRRQEAIAALRKAFSVATPGSKYAQMAETGLRAIGETVNPP